MTIGMNRKFQLHRNKLEWIYPRQQYDSKNQFCTSTFKYLIKDGNKSCHFVGNSKLKPIGYGALFKHKAFSATLASSVTPNIIAKASHNTTNTSSTSFHKKSQEYYSKNKPSKYTQRQKYDFDDSI